MNMWRPKTAESNCTLGSTSHPKVNDTLAQLAVATVFSKSDANSRYWKIPLAKESCLLTTFIRPYDCYLFKKVPFQNLMCFGVLSTVNE